ncbi:hypothetical protein PAECIP111892_02000 [Paenibacillus auburnensis]|uniref:Nitroreductase domain-containing protein n=1 Tax=Paenibacillus auburnensis TaxID=2905649 RepID=A0ABM9BX63_9BACL|nr:nitroreductase family protein [Paenibacillus auburnensis]CAH1195265.1 hypothetical protein PAECIP111892_02000 [Paenibacillus auburnensis]
MKKAVKKSVSLALISLSALVLLIVGILFYISGVFQKEAYLEPWNKSYATQFGDPRVRLAAHGLLAASGHNMQPWRISLSGSEPMSLYLYADSSRMSKEADPLARQMMISQGTFLDYIDVAGQKLGYGVGLDLFPMGPYDEQSLAESMDTYPVAKLTLLKRPPQNTPLYDDLFLPDTNRTAYSPAPLTREQIEQLEAVSDGSSVSVRIVQDKDNLDKLGRYAMQGAAIEAAAASVAKESEDIFRANEHEKNQYRYGFSVEGQGTTGFMKHIMQGLVTLFPSMNSGKAASDRLIQSVQTAVNNTPAYALILTKDNSRKSQVLSGIVYSRLILEAHQLGLAMQPLSQVLEEYPQMQAPYQAIHREYAPEGGTIQMLVRLGRPIKEAPLSMRREVTELLTPADAK